MNGRHPLIRHGRWVGLVMVCALFGAAAPVAAREKPLKVTTHTYPNTPVALSRVKASLVETFATSTQLWTPDGKTRGSRVRYANRAGLSPSSLTIAGEAHCTNTSRQGITAIALTIAVLDAFHQPVEVITVQEANVLVSPGQIKRLDWEEPLRAENLFEVAVIVTKIRFADGTVWSAPQEELIDIF